MVEAVDHCRLLPTSILDIYKMIQHLSMRFEGIWVHPCTVTTKLKLGQILAILGDYVNSACIRVKHHWRKREQRSGDNQHPRGVLSCHQQGLRRHANELNISQADGKDGPKAIQEILSWQKREESAIPTSTEGVRYSFIYQKMVSELKSMGFAVNLYDPCIANKIVDGH